MTHSWDDVSMLPIWEQIRPIYEVYAGADIVSWQGMIERQIERMLNDAEKSNNTVIATKLREFLRIWHEHEITGSINRETLDVLKNTAGQLAVDQWNLKNYFSVLRDQLRKLIASEEELPRSGGSAAPRSRRSAVGLSQEPTLPGDEKLPGGQFGAEQTSGEGEEPSEEELADQVKTLVNATAKK